MDREIKFRAWDSVQEKMLPVEAINWRENCISLNEGDYSIFDTFELLKLMQYTGLKDKNGKEIYDGDICKSTEQECYGSVEWNEDESGFYFNIIYDDGCKEEDYLYNYEDIEIVGNIYENKNLLEENK